MTTEQVQPSAPADPEQDYQLCVICGEMRAYMGEDVTCDHCGACEWEPCDESGEPTADGSGGLYGDVP